MQIIQLLKNLEGQQESFNTSQPYFNPQQYIPTPIQQNENQSKDQQSTTCKRGKNNASKGQTNFNMPIVQ